MVIQAAPVVETTVEVRVMHLAVRLARVVFPGGHHLVVGGRLVSSCEGRTLVPHPDMPAYGMGDFPVPFLAWCDGKHHAVRVEVMNRLGKMQEVSAVRASSILFTPCEQEAVRKWIEERNK